VSPAARALRAAITVYRHSLSLVLGRRCRYAPTCSAYAHEAVGRHGAWVGAWLTLARLLRCNPFGPSGFDPVPDMPADARRRPWRHAHWSGRHMPPESRLDV
jgi:uncharacterized protein